MHITHAHIRSIFNLWRGATQRHCLLEADVGRLKKTGAVFDKMKNKPFCFRLGVGEVIQGWDIGIRGMRAGDKRRITVPQNWGTETGEPGPYPRTPPSALMSSSWM